MVQTKRLTALDSVRGIAVILMIATHIWISFFWDNTNPIGTTISFLGGYLSFQLFLMVSGFLIGYGYDHLDFKKTLKRSAGLFVVYLGLGVFYTLMQQKDILSLFTGPIYLEEYLLTLAILPIFAYLLIAVFRRITITKKILTHSVGGLLVLLIGLLFVILGKYTATINTNYWLSLIVGSSSFHTFPLISYGVVYGVGIWLGWSKKLESPKDYGIEALSVILATLVISFIAIPLEKISLTINDLDIIRWPPTLFFIASGITVSALIVYLATLLEREKQNILSTSLQWVGKQAILFFIFHLVFIYTVQSVTIGKVIGTVKPTEPLITPTPISHEERVSRMLSSSYERKDEWPFLGYKAAFIKFNDDYKAGAAHVDIHPLDIQTNANGSDISVYGLLKNGGVKKLETKFANFGYNNIIVNFTTEESFEGIAVSFTETVSIAPQTHLPYITQTTEPSGTKLGIINKDITEWAFKPFETIGKKWFVKNTPNNSVQAFLFTMPVTCEDLSLYLEDAQRVIKLTENDKELAIENPECVNLDHSELFPAGFIPAMSTITMPVSIDFANEGTGKRSVTYGVTLKKEGTDPIVYSDQKNYWVSYPVYIAWTLDWEGYAVNQGVLDSIARIRTNNPGLVITHMFNPRLWNTSVVSKSVAQNMVNYVNDGYKKFGDEIALHLHMYRDMLTSIGVTPLEIPGWNNLTDGYDIPISEYAYEDHVKMFNWAVAEFPKKGLPKPTTFRSGGWFSSTNVLKAASEAGIKIDTSGRTAYSTRSFGRGTLYNGPWSLSTTTQPYWVSKTDINKSTSKANSIGIYEMPNNGGDSWAFTVDAMVKRMADNANGETFSGPRMITYISHPDYFNKEGPKIEQVLNLSRMYMANSDSGPYVYITLQGYYNLYAK